jgi:hypothetical protein
MFWLFEKLNNYKYYQIFINSKKYNNVYELNNYNIIKNIDNYKQTTHIFDVYIKDNKIMYEENNKNDIYVFEFTENNLINKFDSLIIEYEYNVIERHKLPQLQLNEYNNYHLNLELKIYELNENTLFIIQNNKKSYFISKIIQNVNLFL